MKTAIDLNYQPVACGLTLIFDARLIDFASKIHSEFAGPCHIAQCISKCPKSAAAVSRPLDFIAMSILLLYVLQDFRLFHYALGLAAFSLW